MRRSRCLEHARAYDRADSQRRGTRSERGLDNRWLRLRDRVVRQHVKAHGWVCPGWQRPPHPVDRGQLTGDHVIPRSQRPDLAHDPSNVAVLCMSCNAAKGATG